MVQEREVGTSLGSIIARDNRVSLGIRFGDTPLNSYPLSDRTMQQLKPISTGSRKRAGSADPNERQCLIENFPEEQGVEVAHIFARENSTNSTLVRNFDTLMWHAEMFIVLR